MTSEPKSEFTFHIPPECKEPVQVLFADDDILVVNKPAGLLSVPGRIVKDCVINRMVFEYPDVQAVHRLDLDTSGLLVIALSKVARSDLNRQFRERVVQKQYVARVFGRVALDRGEINLPIAPDFNNRPRQLIDYDKGKASQTFYEVLERDDESTRLLLKPVTGRSHQLRIHLANINHPILGCDLYAHEQAFNAAERLLLHASQLGFNHPKSGESLVFDAPVPF